MTPNRPVSSFFLGTMSPTAILPAPCVIEMTGFEEELIAESVRERKKKKTDGQLTRKENGKMKEGLMKKGNEGQAKQAN